MSKPSNSDYTEVRAVPSVSRDRWLDHARKKLEKGYSLIVSESRKNANFYLPGKGYETCQHKTAVLLIKQGVVKKDGKHHLGTMYRLSDKPLILDQAAPVDEEEDVPVAETETDYEDILDELESTEEEEDDEESEDD